MRIATWLYLTCCLVLNLPAQYQFQEGDLLFQDLDCGPFCDAIEEVTEGYRGAEFSHVGLLYIDDQGKWSVIEADSDGVISTPVDSFLYRSLDDECKAKVVVGRFKVSHRQYIKPAISYAKSKLGVAYDFSFDINNDQYYCSELMYFAFKDVQGLPIFQLQPMTFISPRTNQYYPIWETYFSDLQIPIPQGEPGLNPAGMSRCPHLELLPVFGVVTDWNPEPSK